MSMLDLFYKYHKHHNHNLEVISIHIPKTAGTSFYHTLQDVYGQDSCLEVKRESSMENRYRFHKLIHSQHKVLHGHFLYEEVSNVIKPTCKIITWLRHPVDRVISNYFFWKNRILTDPNHHQSHRRKETLLEYASRKECRNRATDFLYGISLSNLDFIGFQESYHEDLQVLGRLMNWKEVKAVELNKGLVKRTVDADIRKQIENLNRQDLDQYHYALSLRNRL